MSVVVCRILGRLKLKIDTELGFFCLLVRHGSLTSAAREMNLSIAAISRRLTNLERRLGVKLLIRSTRRISLTNEGEVYFTRGQRILADLDEMEQTVCKGRSVPKGLLRINALRGIGRAYIGSAILNFTKSHQEIDVQLNLVDRSIELLDTSMDIAIYAGEIYDQSLISRSLATSRRITVASPAYLKSNGTPKHPHDLIKHKCIILKDQMGNGNQWNFCKGEKSEVIEIHGKLSTNDSNVAIAWALDEGGIIMGARCEFAKLLRGGQLIEVLSDYETPAINIGAAFPEDLRTSARVNLFLDYLEDFLKGQADRPL